MKNDPVTDKATIAGPDVSADAVLIGRMSSLPRAISPPNDPWEKIEQRILASSSDSVQTVQSRSPAWLAVAASLMLVVVSVVFVVQNPEPAGPESFPQAKGKAPVSQSMPMNHQTSILNDRGARVPALYIEREYQAAFREFRSMEAVADIRSMEMDAGLILGWEEMQEVESALKLALEKDPANSILVHRLTKLRARQLQFLHLIVDSGQAPGSNLI